MSIFEQFGIEAIKISDTSKIKLITNICQKIKDKGEISYAGPDEEYLKRELVKFGFAVGEGVKKSKFSSSSFLLISHPNFL